MLLVIVLTLSLAAAAFLIYEVVTATSDMNSSMAKVEELKKEIQAKNAQDIIPSDENLEMIAEDRKAVAIKKQELQKLFGNPYGKAVERMAAVLGVSDSELRSHWKNTYQRETAKGNPRELILSMFFKEFGAEKEAQAITAFKNALKGSPEPLNDANIKGCVMEALGVQRKMQPLLCKKFLRDTIHNLDRQMTTLKKKDDTKFKFGGEKDKTVKYLTFAKYHGDALPRPEEVPFIFKHLKLLEDMMGRMKTAGISGLLDISRESMMGKTADNDYLVLTYTVKVKGSLDSIRAFTNNLMEAYKDNRIYVIRSITLQEEDEAGKIFSDTGKASGTPNGNPSATSPSGLSGPPPIPALDDPKENEVLIGNSDLVSAELTIDYIIYTGNDLASGGK